MKTDNLHDAIGMIDDELLRETDALRRNAKRRRGMLKYLSVAACACLIAGASLLLGLLPHMTNENDPPISVGTGAIHDENITEQYLDKSESNGVDTEGVQKDEGKEEVGSLADVGLKPSQIAPDSSGGNKVLNLSAKNLLTGISPEAIKDVVSPVLFSKTVCDFSVDLFKASAFGSGNEVVSPLSALYAMAMCAIGADGETLSQIEDAVGMTENELKTFLYSYMNSLPTGTGYKLNIANSAWIKDIERFSVSREYLRDITSYLKADVYKAPFDDTTVEDINKWVSERTEGMIDKMLEEISPHLCLELINALYFEAYWDEPFYTTYKDSFTLEDGTVKKCDMMGDTLYNAYVEDENTTGFIKYYNDKTYAFVAMLPKEGLTLAEYLDTLNGEKLNNLVNSVNKGGALIKLPKFSASYDTSLKAAFMGMGVTDAFNGDIASFPAFDLEGENIKISDVHQKTVITIDELGTKAGSVTDIPMAGTSLAPKPTVYLNRPFVYMIIDCENSIPLFFGTVTDVGE